MTMAGQVHEEWARGLTEVNRRLSAQTGACDIQTTVASLFPNGLPPCTELQRLPAFSLLAHRAARAAALEAFERLRSEGRAWVIDGECWMLAYRQVAGPEVAAALERAAGEIPAHLHGSAGSLVCNLRRRSNWWSPIPDPDMQALRALVPQLEAWWQTVGRRLVAARNSQGV